MALTEDPENSRFQHHVSFDNFAIEEPTKRNTVSLTLNVKHQGYQYKRRSRTFMVGIDENDYSDIAVQWLLEELVDDGDEIICLRVIDKDSKMLSERKKQYQAEAEALMKSIQKKNDYNRAISIVLEFSVGKVHTTFQKMVSNTPLCRDSLIGSRFFCLLLRPLPYRFRFTNRQCSSLVLADGVLVGSKDLSPIETPFRNGVYSTLQYQLLS